MSGEKGRKSPFLAELRRQGTHGLAELSLWVKTQSRYGIVHPPL
ncbi:hypothetical protein [Gluconobacter wancherniae]|nr:hypothetical protein [Gluconobacter wancherniae]